MFYRVFIVVLNIRYRFFRGYDGVNYLKVLEGESGCFSRGYRRNLADYGGRFGVWVWTLAGGKVEQYCCRGWDDDNGKDQDAF